MKRLVLTVIVYTLYISSWVPAILAAVFHKIGVKKIADIFGTAFAKMIIFGLKLDHYAKREIVL